MSSGNEFHDFVARVLKKFREISLGLNNIWILFSWFSFLIFLVEGLPCTTGVNQVLGSTLSIPFMILKVWSISAL